MGNPRSDGLFGGIHLAAVGRAEDDEAGQINAEVPRSQMGAAERKRRRELAKERCIRRSYDLKYLDHRKKIYVLKLKR